MLLLFTTFLAALVAFSHAAKLHLGTPYGKEVSLSTANYTGNYTDGNGNIQLTINGDVIINGGPMKGYHSGSESESHEEEMEGYGSHLDNSSSGEEEDGSDHYEEKFMANIPKGKGIYASDISVCVRNITTFGHPNCPG